MNTVRRTDWYSFAHYQQIQEVRLTGIYSPSCSIHAESLHKLLHLTDIKRPSDFVGDPDHSETPLKCFFHFDIPQYLKCELLGQNTGLLCDLPASFLTTGALRRRLSCRSDAKETAIFLTKSRSTPSAGGKSLPFVRSISRLFRRSSPAHPSVWRIFQMNTLWQDPPTSGRGS